MFDLVFGYLNQKQEVGKWGGTNPIMNVESFWSSDFEGVTEACSIMGQSDVRQSSIYARSFSTKELDFDEVLRALNDATLSTRDHLEGQICTRSQYIPMRALSSKLSELISK